MQVARRKLLMIEAASNKQDLRNPPGHRLEELQGKRKGQCSIRINDQYRIGFTWPADGKAYNIEITDYHDE